MGLYTEWLEKTDENRYSVDQINKYIGEYYEREKDAYAMILAAKENKVCGTVAELADRFRMDCGEITGFVDGINTSLEAQLDPEALTEESQLVLDINWEKLYYNMNKAKAPWLYELPEWEGILDQDERMAIRAQYRKDNQAVRTKIDRNAPCPCGSGKKYKKCCGKDL